jgi:hypothetical protein
VDGDPVVVYEGEVVRATHTVVQDREDLFESAAAGEHVDHEN